MNQLYGRAFTYNKQGSVAVSNNIQSNLTIIFIAGLGDSALRVQFIPALNSFCKDYSINLTIPQLRSMPNYRCCPIQSDIQDITQLIENIKTDIILLGHSTGCQDALLYLKSGHSRQKLKAIFLQAPVSDVQYQIKVDPKIQDKIIQAKNNPCLMYQNKVWLSQRFLSLFQKFNKQDLFSSYLPNQSYINWKCQVPIISVVSTKDQYRSDNEQKLKLGSKVYMIKQGDHSLTQESCQQELINILKQELMNLGLILSAK